MSIKEVSQGQFGQVILILIYIGGQNISKKYDSWNNFETNSINWINHY